MVITKEKENHAANQSVEIFYGNDHTIAFFVCIIKLNVSIILLLSNPFLILG
jgi:hypothetical protein